MPSAWVEKLEERWTPSTIQTAFTFRPPPHRPKSGGVSIDFPLLNLGWTFALSLTPEKPQKKGISNKRACNWIPAAFSFQQTEHNGAIRWENTSILAELSLGEECPPPNNTNGNSTPLCRMSVVLADTPSLQLPLPTSPAISLLQPNKIWLTVTISECSFANGLFDARSGPVNEAKIVLNQSLTTGKLFDVKFLACSTRFASGNTGKPLPTYASLSVVEKHIDLSSSILREDWTNAQAALDSATANHVTEISCPKDYEYELDSDLEDEDEASSTPCDWGGEGDVAREDSSAERSGSSLSPFELEGASDHSLVDNQLEELIKDAKEPPLDYERTIWVKFAAHRTWHAFLWYCYTGDLEFGRLRSQVEPGGWHPRVTPLTGGPPTCSPKSMYRLAELLGDKNLKAKALAAIEERTAEANVLDETFSVFTSRYPDVREVQLVALTEHRRSPKVKEAFLTAMEKYSSTPHAKPVLSAFFDILAA